MSLILKLAAVVLVLNLAYDAEAKDCTSLPPMENFEVNKFLGKWHEQRRYVKLTSVNPKCVSSVSSLDKKGDGTIDAEFSELVKVNGTWQLVNIPNKAKLLQDKVGKFELTFPEEYKSDNGVYTVLGTDYTSYYVLASCENGNVKGDTTALAWIYSRAINPEALVIEKALKIAEKAGLKTKQFFTISQIGCNRLHHQINVDE